MPSILVKNLSVAGEMLTLQTRKMRFREVSWKMEYTNKRWIYVGLYYLKQKEALGSAHRKQNVHRRSLPSEAEKWLLIFKTWTRKVSPLRSLLERSASRLSPGETFHCIVNEQSTTLKSWKQLDTTERANEHTNLNETILSYYVSEKIREIWISVRNSVLSSQYHNASMPLIKYLLRILRQTK